MSIPKWKSFSGYRGYKLNDEILVPIFNFHSKYPLYTGLNISPELLPDRISISDAINKYYILPPSGRAFWTQNELQQELLLKIPPMDVRFFIIKPYQKKLKGVVSVNNDTVHQEYDRRSLLKDQSFVFEPVINGGSKAIMKRY